MDIDVLLASDLSMLGVLTVLTAIGLLVYGLLKATPGNVGRRVGSEDGVPVKYDRHNAVLTVCWGGAPEGLRIEEQLGYSEREDELSFGDERLDGMFRVYADDREAAQELLAVPSVRAALPELLMSNAIVVGGLLHLRQEPDEPEIRRRAARLARALETGALESWRATGLTVERQDSQWLLTGDAVVVVHRWDFRGATTELRRDGAPTGLTLARGESELSNPILASQVAVEGTHPALEDAAVTEAVLVAVVEHGLELRDGQVRGRWEGFVRDPRPAIAAADALVAALALSPA